MAETTGNASTPAVRWLGLAFVAAGVLTVLGGWAAYWQDLGISRSGQRAVATITKKVAAVPGQSGPAVEYWFALPDGQRIESRRTIDKPIWEGYVEGGKLTVLYATAAPDRNFPLGGGVTSMGVTFFTTVAGAIMFITGLLICSAARRRAG